MTILNKALDLVDAGTMDKDEAERLLEDLRAPKKAKVTASVRIDPDLKGNVIKRVGKKRFSELVERLLSNWYAHVGSKDKGAK